MFTYSFLVSLLCRTGTSAPHVNFSTENGIQEGENKGSKANALLEGTRDRPGTEAQPPEFLQNTATCRSLHSAPIDVGPGTYGINVCEEWSFDILVETHRFPWGSPFQLLERLPTC